MLLLITHALELSADQFYARKSPYEHSVRNELAKLINVCIETLQFDIHLVHIYVVYAYQEIFYTKYMIPYVLEYFNFEHTRYIHTWYIRTETYVVPWYHTRYDI